jgi:hypothetical protein
MKRKFLIGLIMLAPYFASSQKLDSPSFFETKATVDFLIDCVGQEWQDVYIKSGNLNGEIVKNLELKLDLKRDFVNDQKLAESEYSLLVRTLKDYVTYEAESSDSNGNTVAYFCPDIPSDFSYRLSFLKNSQVFMFIYLSKNTSKITVHYVNKNIHFIIDETCINSSVFKRTIESLRLK